MIAAASWLCLLAPLAGALLITVGGTLLSRTVAGWIATLSVFVGFAGAVVAFVKVAGESPDGREHLSTAYTWFGVKLGFAECGSIDLAAARTDPQTLVVDNAGRDLYLIKS